MKRSCGLHPKYHCVDVALNRLLLAVIIHLMSSWLIKVLLGSFCVNQLCRCTSFLLTLAHWC